MDGIEPQVARSASSALARQAAVIGCGTVLGAFCVSILWTFAWPVLGGMFMDTMLWILLPCMLIASVLSAFSLRGSRGTQLPARVVSLVLWTAATPLIWGFGLFLWSGFASGEWRASGAILFGASPVGLALWCVTVAPGFAVLLGRRLLRHDPWTSFGPSGPGSVHGRAEQEEDVEVFSARSALREVFSRDDA